MDHGTVAEKSLEFAVRIVNVHKHLASSKKSTSYPNSFCALEPALVQISQKHSAGKVQLTLLLK